MLAYRPNTGNVAPILPVQCWKKVSKKSCKTVTGGRCVSCFEMCVVSEQPALHAICAMTVLAASETPAVTCTAVVPDTLYAAPPPCSLPHLSRVWLLSTPLSGPPPAGQGHRTGTIIIDDDYAVHVMPAGSLRNTAASLPRYQPRCRQTTPVTYNLWSLSQLRPPS